MKWGSVTPINTEVAITGATCSITHFIWHSTYTCIVFFLQYDFYPFLGETISDTCVVPCLSVVQVKIIKWQSINIYNYSFHLFMYVYIKILMTLKT